MSSNIMPNIIPNNYTMENYSTKNDFAIYQNDEPNIRQISSVGMQNNFINPAAPKSETYECYLPMPNERRFFHVTYTEIDEFEITQLLNNNINLSHIPNHQFPHHYNIQNSIQRHIIQNSQQNYNFYNGINDIREDTMGPGYDYITDIPDIQNSSGHEVLLQQKNYQLYNDTVTHSDADLTDEF
ncbi:uncharacterized protein OCT59_017033 [Rhizophagus irregularis]|uniref:Uncharacterized protein n=2 Tax=Rhizophagus irregularis TaxID=588596 RepID=U9SXS4_RHIID|nr:hypothetical protein GLOIN_2v1588729 [Rhizophagus irregularis DAOM 181602=DAOM 197198]EXX66565.1 hypothetical protein RirG_122660 [Rhizophagus irregularis DAOM 197198w]UZO24739.1 hypothetical protein OCT59_017033 [Rhizophagus irregularis]POG73175.1 hypothetical protein GLOIN_2v1588729 [Rhizophagus irregularis DAOM 181602=DAOM 197198]CAG8539023.1 22723_t:CDS:1 [Rhizophagus irregularis]GBC14685.2 hypothetical protein GLOIN_2v1588729 [Rhizophagus irregularis DAOM 181602=DAOM 197198]|eukprot:XP_025180041.1 hypothetical protein GLOIN_2v1588729 [Rhizophagus irregularis DAOM 181602=DAOM 197198]